MSHLFGFPLVPLLRPPSQPFDFFVHTLGPHVDDDDDFLYSILLSRHRRRRRRRHSLPVSDPFYSSIPLSVDHALAEDHQYKVLCP